MVTLRINILFDGHWPSTELSGAGAEAKMERSRETGPKIGIG